MTYYVLSGTLSLYTGTTITFVMRCFIIAVEYNPADSVLIKQYIAGLTEQRIAHVKCTFIKPTEGTSLADFTRFEPC